MKSPTINEKWEALMGLEEAFSHILTIQFLAQNLQEAVDEGDMPSAKKASRALDAFLPVFTDYYDEKFRDAWDTLINKKPNEQENS